MITHKQLTLAEIFEDCQNKFDNDKPAFLSLLETHIDLDKLIKTAYQENPLPEETTQKRNQKKKQSIKFSQQTRELQGIRLLFINTSVYLLITTKLNET